MIPTIGRIVHVHVTPDHFIPAIVVAVWNEDCINVQAFPDGGNSALYIEHAGGPQGCVAVQDIEKSGGAPCWLTSINEGSEPGNWFWPPRA